MYYTRSKRQGEKRENTKNITIIILKRSTSWGCGKYTIEKKFRIGRDHILYRSQRIDDGITCNITITWTPHFPTVDEFFPPLPLGKFSKQCIAVPSNISH